MNLHIYTDKERLPMYERLSGTYLDRPVKVEHFDFDPVDYLNRKGVKIAGRAHQEAKGYVIGLRYGLGERELWTLAHELAHILMGHAKAISSILDIAVNDRRIAETIDGEKGEEKEAAYMDMERQVDECADRILEHWHEIGIEW